MRKSICICLMVACGTGGSYAQEGISESKYTPDGRHKGLDYNVSLGYHVGVGDFKNVGAVPVEVGLGKQFNPNLYFGLGTGVWVGTKGSDPVIPVTADVKAMFPLKSGGAKPIINFRFGYMFNTADAIGGRMEVDDGFGGKAEIDVPKKDVPNYVLMQIMPGVQFPMSKKTDFLLSAGYTHAFLTEGGGGGGYFTVKAGFNFHKDPNKKKRLPREKVDTRARGFQMTLEGLANKMEGWNGGVDMVLGYKINTRFSAGFGVGFEGLDAFEEGGKDIQLVTLRPLDNMASSPEVTEIFESYGKSLNRLNLFFRGTYRAMESRLSPLVSVDLGCAKYFYGGDGYGVKSTVADELEKTRFFVSPAVGGSLRTTNNSYLTLRMGYTMTSGVEKKQDVSEGSWGTTYIAMASRKLSGLYFSLGFTHTFGKRGRRPVY